MGLRHPCRDQVHCRAIHALDASRHTPPEQCVWNEFQGLSIPLICSHHPTPVEKYFAAQSLDNQILVYSTDNFRQARNKRFAGHSVAGYACQVGFSPDGKWISSGDGEGNVVFWEWKTGRIKSRLRAHSKVVIAHEWLPHETVSAFSTRPSAAVADQSAASPRFSRRSLPLPGTVLSSYG